MVQEQGRRRDRLLGSLLTHPNPSYRPCTHGGKDRVYTPLPWMLMVVLVIIRSSAASASGLLARGKRPTGAKSATMAFTVRILTRSMISVITAAGDKAKISWRKYNSTYSRKHGRFPLCLSWTLFSDAPLTSLEVYTRVPLKIL